VARLVAVKTNFQSILIKKVRHTPLKAIGRQQDEAISILVAAVVAALLTIPPNAAARDAKMPRR